MNDIGLKPCECGNNHLSILLSSKIGIPSGDKGWQAIIQCGVCGKRVKRWALKKTWADRSVRDAWNGRTDHDN